MLRLPRALGQPPPVVDAIRRKLLNLEAKMMNNLVALAAEDLTLFLEKDVLGEILARIRRTRTTGPTLTLDAWFDSSGRAEKAYIGLH